MLKFHIDSSLFGENCQVKISKDKQFETDVVVLDGDINFDLICTKLEKEINISGKAVCHIKSSCGRCLEDFTDTLVVPLNYTRDFNWDEEDEVDLTEEVRDGILLTLPINPLCKNECKGICQHCGKNKNKDICSCKDDAEEFSPFSSLKKIKFR